MIYLYDILDVDKLKEHLVNGVVRSQVHPVYPHLFILNYTEKAQFDRIWDDVTNKCRGLIVESHTAHDPFVNATVVARAFNKFHNLNTEYIPETMEVELAHHKIEHVTDKLDGCFLGNTAVNLWDGGTISIREIVKNHLSIKLVGMNAEGKLVPTEVIDWYDNGVKDNWLLITVDCLPSLKSGCRTGNHIPVTPNHHILLNGEYQPAAYAELGDTVTTQELRPDDNVLEVIQAGLLGDGSLSFNGQRSCTYGENHKQEHLEFVKEIRHWLGDCAIKSDVPIVSGYGTVMEQANAKAYLSLEKMRKRWYPKGIKVVPKNLSWINDFCVAKWYMDDGHLSHSELQQDRAEFATNGFKKEDCERLALKLQELYDIDCQLTLDNRGKKSWSIRVNAGRKGEINKFWQAIAPHVVPCLRYKLPAKYRDVKYVKRPFGKELRVQKNVKIINISKLTGNYKTATHSYFRSGRKGFDIKTTTGNYMVKGILVHNSLGVIFKYDSQWHVATRGSFDSDQARWATAYLREHLRTTELLHPDVPFPLDWTPVCEIIYAANRIVVSYDYEGLVLLGFVNPADAREMPRAMAERGAGMVGLPIVKKFKKTLSECAAENVPNSEGYVITYSHGVKVKVKFAEYVRLHRILTGLSPIAVWEMRKAGQNEQIRLLLEDPTIPEGFKTWLEKWDHKLSLDYMAIDAAVSHLFAQAQALDLVRSISEIEHLPPCLMVDLDGTECSCKLYTKEERKNLAMWVLEATKDTQYLKGFLFALADGHPIDGMIWDQIRPNGKDVDTFKKDSES